MRLLTKVDSTFGRIIDLLSLLAAGILVLIILIVSAEIVMRYFLGRPISWVLETSEYALLYITFLGAVWVLRVEGHVKMDVVLTQLNPRSQALVNMITSIAGAIAFLIVTWYSAQVSWSDLQTGYRLSTELRPPRFPIGVIIPVGSFLLGTQFLRKSYGYLVSWRGATKTKMKG